MKRHLKFAEVKSLFLLVIFFSIAAVTKAGLIELPPYPGGHLISAHSPIGQSFTAEDPKVIIGLYISDSGFGATDCSLSVRLHEGQGVAGELLDSRVVTPSAEFEGYLDVDYSDIELNPGSFYSVTLSSGSSKWVSNSSQEKYPGGSAIIQGALWPELDDKAFRVIPIAEPSTVLLLGLGGLTLLKKRKR